MSSPQRIGANPRDRLPSTEKMAKKWLRPITGTIAIASRVLDICTSAANRPIKNCRARTSASQGARSFPATKLQPATISDQVTKENISTGLLPRWSSREPRNQRLHQPPRNITEFTHRTLPSAMPTSAFKNATVKAVMPPYASDHATMVRSSLRNGAKRTISSHGTPPPEAGAGSGAVTSGMRLRKNRLATPMRALKQKSTEYCQGRGCWPRHVAASIKLTQLARLTHAASRARYFPRTAAGTSNWIQGSQPALEIPRERLKPNNSRSISARRVVEFKKP